MSEGLPDEATVFYVQALSICPTCGKSVFVDKDFKRICPCGRLIVALDHSPKKLYEITEQLNLE